MRIAKKLFLFITGIVFLIFLVLLVFLSLRIVAIHDSLESDVYDIFRESLDDYVSGITSSEARALSISLKNTCTTVDMGMRMYLENGFSASEAESLLKKFRNTINHVGSAFIYYPSGDGSHEEKVLFIDQEDSIGRDPLPCFREFSELIKSVRGISGMKLISRSEAGMDPEVMLFLYVIDGKKSGEKLVTGLEIELESFFEAVSHPDLPGSGGAFASLISCLGTQVSLTADEKKAMEKDQTMIKLLVPVRVDSQDEDWFYERVFIMPEKQINSSVARVQEKTAALLTTVYAVFAAAFLVIIFFTFLLARNIVIPLKEAVSFSGRLAQGDFSTSIKGGGRRDELGELISSLNHMKNRLQASVTKLRRSHNRERGMREEIESVNRMRKDFLDKMTMQLKSPVNLILSNTEMLIRRLQSEDENRRDNAMTQARELKKNAGDMLTLISRLIELSRFDVPDHMQLDIRRFATDEFLKKVLDFNIMAAEHRSISLAYSFSAEAPPEIKTDPDILLQLLSGFINTALNISQEGGFVSFDCEAAGSDIFFRIRYNDNGAGDTDLPELYRQFREMKSEVIAYTGGNLILNLSLFQANAKLLGGKLVVEREESGSVALGVSFARHDIIAFEGMTTSRIRVASNVRKEWKQRYRDIEHSKEHAMRDRDMSVLVLENNKNKAERLGEFFDELSIDYTVAQNCAECLQILEKDSAYNLVVLDMDTDYSAKCGCIKDILSARSEKPIPLVAILSDQDAEKYGNLKKIGISECLHKPLNTEDFLRTAATLA